MSLRPVEQFLEGRRVAGLLCKESLETEISSLTRKLESAVEFRRIVKVRDLYLIFSLICRCGGMADATRSKRVGSNIMWVQVPLPALVQSLMRVEYQLITSLLIVSLSNTSSERTT